MSSINKMHEWFKYLFEQRMDDEHNVYCFECGRKLPEHIYKEISAIYSHILPKSTYPDMAGNPDNVKIVCMTCHNLYTMLPSNAKKQYKEYLKLKQDEHIL